MTNKAKASLVVEARDAKEAHTFERMCGKQNTAIAPETQTPGRIHCHITTNTADHRRSR